MRLRKGEIGLLVFGFAVFALSTYLFSVDTDSVLRWIGFERFSKRPKIAQVEVTRNMVRRKEFEMPEFRSIDERQTVFSKDSIMTGSESGAVLRFVDGSVVELGPDTLVQMETRGSPEALGNFELVLDLKKGEVTGVSSSPKLKVVQNKKVIKIAPAKKESLAVAVVEKKPIERTTDCQFALPVQSGTLIEMPMICDDGVMEKEVKIYGGNHSLIETMTMPIAPNHRGLIRYTAKAPGSYAFEIIQKAPKTVVVQVSERESDLKWDAAPILCGQFLRYQSTGKDLKRLILQGQTEQIDLGVSAQKGGVVGPFNQLKVPVQVKIVEEYANGFKSETPVLDVKQWRVCPVLKTPINGGEEKSVPLRGVMFTWVSLGQEASYLFELAADSEFKKILFSKTVQMNLIRFETSARGLLYWRVTDVKSKESSAPFKVIIK